MRSLIFALATMAAVASGCSRKEQSPLLAGGREVSSWVADLKDPRPAVRRQAVLKLGNVGDADPAAADGLASALGDSDVQIRRDAVHAVVKLKQPGDGILTRLREMNRTDPDATVRDFAGRALAKLGHAE